MQRALRYDGLLPAVQKAGGGWAEITPGDIRNMKAYIAQRRTLETPFDIIVEGETIGNPAKQADIACFADAGVTWWLETLWDLTTEALKEETQAQIQARVLAGPPKI